MKKFFFIISFLFISIFSLSQSRTHDNGPANIVEIISK